LAREPKYRLLLKFVQRLAMAGGVLPPGAVPSARVAFGSFLPSDRSQIVEQVARLLEVGAVSTQTAVHLLVAAGVSVPDAEREVDRVRYEHPEKAAQIADATASEQLAAEWLGVDIPDDATPGAPTVRPAPTVEIPEPGGGE
jgi:hypothetical protein